MDDRTRTAVAFRVDESSPGLKFLHRKATGWTITCSFASSFIFPPEGAAVGEESHQDST